MMEKVYTFGRDACLVGIVTEPSADGNKESTPAVLVWNAGLLHRVGPHRLYVDLARKLASMGFLVFRFDLSGKGDSGVGKDSRSYKQRAVANVREAMDFLSIKKGVHQFVLIGLCSGADDAHSVAVVDSRVSGAVFLDGYGYRTWAYYPHHYAPRLLNLKIWKNFLKRKYYSVFIGAPTEGDETGLREKINTREFPPKKNVKADLVKLIQRGVNLLYIYSGMCTYYSYPAQFEDMFRPIDFQGKLQLEYFNEVDHTYPILAHREKLIITISDWMQAHCTTSKQFVTR